MTGADVILDTNAAIFLLNKNLKFWKVLDQISKALIPLPVLAELEFGAANSANSAGNREKLDALLLDLPLLLPDRETARVYGEVLLQLKRKGRPIPVNDLWIAALSVQHGMPIVTRDAHFHEVNGIQVISW